MSERKRKTRRSLRNDSNQFIFDEEGHTGRKKTRTTIMTTVELKAVKYLCPFCLHSGYIHEYTHKLKSGGESKRLHCPECDVEMRKESLTDHKTIEEYAEWVFNYSMSGFWKKCPFDKFNDRLYKLGMSYRFWKKYKELKGNKDKEQTYEEHMMDYQDEWLKYEQEHEAEKEQDI